MDYIKNLLKQFRKGNLNEHKKQLLYRWLDEFNHPDATPLEEHELQKSLLSFKERMAQDQAVKPAFILHMPVRLFRRIAAAASLLLLFSAGFYFFYRNSHLEADIVTNILPGGKKALLTLSNGITVNLDSIQPGNIITDSGFTIEKKANGELYYHSTGNRATGATSAMNVISTPRGGEYTVFLPDGSSIVLNYESTLRYPIAFSKEKREVQLLKGEAFFNIAKVKAGKQPVPFFVTVNNQVVKVLGTQFNINTYESAYISTTLIEGSVQVSAEKESFNKTLKPGQQLLFNKTDQTMRVKEVPLEGVTAWKEGFFYFENASLQTVLDAYSRWYNIEVENKHPNAEQSDAFYGKIPRNTNLHTALNILKTTTGINYKMENRKLIIY